MKVIELTLDSKKETKISFVINGNVAFYDGVFQDGNHNNGGWRVKETKKEILERIKNAENI